MAGTIQQIAQLAGVSRGTVDRVLNHRGRVRPEVAERVTRVAAELGYVPKHPKTQELGSKTIGVVTQLCHSSFMIAVNRGIADIRAELESQGIRVLLREGSGVDEAEQLRAIDELEAAGIDALAIMPVDCDGVRLRLNRLHSEHQLPIVTFNTDLVGTERLCFVGLDNWRSGQAAAGLMGLMTRGSGKILGITGYFSNSAGSRRVDGFVEELKKQFPNLELVGIQSSFDQSDEVERIILHTMAVYPDLAGIFIASGGQAGVVRAFEKLRLKRRPYVIIYDLTPKNERYLREGAVDFLIDQEGYLQSYRAIGLLADQLRWGRAPEREYMYTEICIKTKYNL